MSEHSDTTSPIGRKQTDKSLSDERAKTDESLSAGREKTERQADQAVSTSRAAADETKNVARLDADDTSDTDERLRQERRSADKALETERRHMDLVLHKEREDKKTAELLLFQSEREETDKNLTNERQQSDIEAQRSARILSDEQTSHLATKAALTTRDEFLAIVSHDLRNPLSSISMAAELVTASPYFSHADHETREHIEIIQKNAGEALRLISDLLDVERIAGNKLDLNVMDHSTDDILGHSVKMFQSQASAKKLTLRCNSQHEKSIVHCDRDRISQVLSNLIGNAIKFTPSGGRVTVSAVSVAGSTKISVVDDGPGIPLDMQKVVFGRYWQIGKQDRRGLGLGLYISSMIVNAHGGRIWVESAAGKGCTFSFTLPKEYF